MLRVWDLSLVVATFCLTILGTFLTRSGVINSVHAFSESAIGAWLPENDIYNQPTSNDTDQSSALFGSVAAAFSSLVPLPAASRKRGISA